MLEPGDVLLDEEDAFITISERAKIITEEDLSGLKNFEDGMFTFEESDMSASYEVGDIIMLDEADSIQFIVRVESVEQIGNEILIKTASASVFEAFESSYIPISLGNEIEYRTMKCTPPDLKIPGTNCPVTACVTYDISKENPMSISTTKENIFVSINSDFIFNVSMEVDCNQQLNISTEIDLSKYIIKGLVKGAIKKGLKKSIKLKGLPDKYKDKIINKIADAIDVTIGLRLHKFKINGELDLKFTTGVVGKLDLDVTFKKDLDGIFSGDTVEDGDNKSTYVPTKPNLEGPIKIDCNAFIDLRSWGGLVLKIPEISWGPVTFIEELILINARAGSGYKILAKKTQVNNEIHLKPTILYYHHITNESDISFLKLPPKEFNFFQPRTWQGIRLCDGISVIKENTTTNTNLTLSNINIHVNGPANSKFNIFLDKNLNQSIGSFDYGVEHNIPISVDQQIFFYRVKDKNETIGNCCELDFPIFNFPLGDDEEENDPTCIQRVNDRSNKFYYCTIKICENNNSLTNCKTWIRRNLRYDGSDVSAPYASGNDNAKRLGRLYSWNEINDVAICPENYRVANKADFEHLFNAIRNNNNDNSLDFEDFHEYLNAANSWPIGSTGNGGEIYSKYFELFPNGYYSTWDFEYQDFPNVSYLWTTDPYVKNEQESTESVLVLRSDGNGVSFVPFVKDAFRLGVRCVCETGC